MNQRNTHSPMREIEGGKFLTFSLGDEQYGVCVLKVREIIGIIEITPVPQTPAFTKGVINLRGHIIPVVDLRTKFDLDGRPHDSETCIIVVEMEETLIGIIVDTVNEVLEIPTGEIEPTPHLGNQVRTDFLLGLGKVQDKIVILLDIDRVLSPEEMGLIRESAEQSAPQT